MMTQQERFLATARFGTPDRAFILPPWTWQETLVRWQAEGLPPDADLPTYFDTDREQGVPLQMQGPYGPHLCPPLDRQVLSETDTHVIVRDEEGNTVKLFKDDPLSSMPMWIEYPMRDRSDWETLIKPRLDASARAGVRKVRHGNGSSPAPRGGMFPWASGAGRSMAGRAASWGSSASR